MRDLVGVSLVTFFFYIYLYKLPVMLLCNVMLCYVNLDARGARALGTSQVQKSKIGTRTQSRTRSPF